MDKDYVRWNLTTSCFYFIMSGQDGTQSHVVSNREDVPPPVEQIRSRKRSNVKVIMFDRSSITEGEHDLLNINWMFLDRVGISVQRHSLARTFRVFNKHTLVVKESMHVVFDESSKDFSEKDSFAHDFLGSLENLTLVENQEVPTSLVRTSQPTQEENKVESDSSPSDQPIHGLPKDWAFKKSHPQELIIASICGFVNRGSRVCSGRLLLCSNPWIKEQLLDYGVALSHIPIKCDNTSAINLSKNHIQHSRSKHIDIRHHFIRDHVQKGDVVIEFIDTTNQYADIFTKPLNEDRMHFIIRELNMLDGSTLS
ncbi:uncharacterized protein LOC126669905 [Mercurialis annua]|uniref:uncharacterized protein LOC126669905 n=1 Tax=Mercurialis annua TaxID=3986 RepID=UPI00215F25C4|nr:uncharacterized protein LOC126669905 [Mercurialis annua]